MKLKDIISAGLLPRFAKDSTWMQEALDSWIRPAVGCFAALGAPFTLEAVQALTDAELQELYAQYNIVDYYPDLSRETRELMIYNISKLRRRLGTKAAVVALVQYVFDGLDLTVDIYDNLAFNDAGELIDESLIDVYDVEITLSDAVLTDEIRKRLLNNIFRLVPDRLGLGNIIYIYPANYIQNRQIIVADIETVIENDAVCEPITPPVQVLTAYFTSAGASGTGDTGVIYNRTYNLYDEQGSLIPLDPSNGYIFIASYTFNGELSHTQIWTIPYDFTLSYLTVRSPYGNQAVFRLEYLCVPQQTGWLSADKLMAPFPQGTQLILYNNNGEKIVYDNTLSYYMYALDFTGTIDNVNLNSYELVDSGGFLACVRREGWHGDNGYGVRFVTRPTPTHAT